jgi:hypothetical protein
MHPIIRLRNKDTNEITRNLAIWNSSKHSFDNHGVWQLGYCTEQKCKVFYDFASKVENRKVLESQLIQVKG